jgi:succinate dehydrogenase (ubiquinone) cytochrome b560 subunit
MRQIISAADSNSILAKQRLNRPTSPHLTIYKPQVTWILSITNRITGGILSAGFYALGLAYLASPVLGWNLDSASMVAAVASWPVAVKIAAKFAVALPFTFHSFNGLRHLVWDTGRQFKNKVVIRTGWTVVGLSVVSALGLTFI